MEEPNKKKSDSKKLALKKSVAKTPAKKPIKKVVKKSVKKPIKKTKKKVVKKPIKKVVKPNKNATKIFNILARKVFQISKRRNLGWKWADVQRWTSKNLFPRYKKYEEIPSGKWAKIDSEIESILDKPQDEVPTATATTATDEAPKEYCFNALKIPTENLEPINWWELADAISVLDDNLKIAVEFDGILNTGIVKKSELPEMIKVRESFRTAKYESSFLIVFRILVAPDKQDDGGDCSYFVLVTTEDSPQDIMSRTGEVDVFVSKKSLPPKTQKEIEEAQKKSSEAEKRRKEEAKVRASKKEAKARPRPQQVEAKTDGKVEVGAEKYNALTKALEILRLDVKEGLITKKQYQKRQQQLLDKFERGGKI